MASAANLYSDGLLSALGAWQRGWQEDPNRRLAITEALLAATESLRDELPLSRPLPICYRKRFLVPHNAQNGGDFVPLVLSGRIDEKVAAWTTDPTLHQQFKELSRFGNVTALFAHQPRRHEVIVDLNALWRDPEFGKAVEDYASRSGENADALLNFKDKQREIILNVPLLSKEVIGFVGAVGDANSIFDALGADTDEKEGEVYKLLMAINVFPGEYRWVERGGAQRAINKTRIKWQNKLNAFAFRLRLFASSNAVPPAEIRDRLIT